VVTQIGTPDLGGGRGRLSDWATQRWVVWSGRRVALAEAPWLDGPVGGTRVIGSDFFDELARERDWIADESSPERGLVDDFAALAGPGCVPAGVHPAVVHFYERTASYDLDVWSEWSGVFRPFGTLLAVLFSRRLQQLNIPLSPLDASLGVGNRVIKLRDRDGRSVMTAWVRELLGSRRTLYAGSYGVCAMPDEPGPCLRVVFPLPNGSAVVVMRPESNPDGSLTVSSFGAGFGAAGFYFFVQAEPGYGYARYVATLKETIRVFVDAEGAPRADHALNVFGRTFLRLHYRMKRRVKG
jgi:hypothetical protein